MKWSITSAAVLVAVLWSVAIGAQSGGTMSTHDKMDKMEMMETSYTGCIESGSTAGTLTLTHLAAADRMGKDMMKKDAMKKDTMAKDGMSDGSVGPTALILSSSSVDLRKHLGHKVTVVGSLAHEKMDAMEKGMMDKPIPAFTVKSLKMIAATCS